MGARWNNLSSMLKFLYFCKNDIISFHLTILFKDNYKDNDKGKDILKII